MPIPIKQPLQRITVFSKPLSESLSQLIMDEVNVKEICFEYEGKETIYISK